MKNRKVTVELWTTVDEDRSAHLNGGNMGIYVYGTIGSVQQTGDKQFQLNVFASGKSSGHYHHSVYTYYPGYGYYNTHQSS